MSREWNESVLRVFLRKLPKDVLVENFISIIKTLCEKDEEFAAITKDIVTIVQVDEILNGEAELKRYEPSRQKELFTRLIATVLGDAEAEKLTPDAVSILLKDFEESKLKFSDWWLGRSLPLTA